MIMTRILINYKDDPDDSRTANYDFKTATGFQTKALDITPLARHLFFGGHQGVFFCSSFLFMQLVFFYLSMCFFFILVLVIRYFYFY